jgi:hypothetical protein
MAHRLEAQQQRVLQILVVAVVVVHRLVVAVQVAPVS